jgi:hypothetical protein
VSGRSALLKRVPVVVVAALGIWLWRGGGGRVPTERTVSFRFGAGPTPARVDVQLYDAEGHLLAQQERAPRAGEALPELSLTVQARPGMLQARVFRWRAGDGAPVPLRMDVPVTGTEAAVVVDVPTLSR